MTIVMTHARGITMPSFGLPTFAAAAIAAVAAYVADAKAVVRTWQGKKHTAIRTNDLGLTAWSPPL